MALGKRARRRGAGSLQTIDQILSLIGQYGYLIVLLGVMAESAGVPFPGETVLLAAGVMAQRGHIDVGDAILFGVLGAVLGDQIGYWVGREGGRPFVLRWGRYLLITPERLARAEAFFARHGGKAVFLARFVVGLRTFGALTAGVSRMHWRTFALYNALGGMVWATAAVAVGYLLGGSLALVERWLGWASILLAVLLAVLLALYLSYRWVAAHPERVRTAFDRVAGGPLGTFLRSPAGLWLSRRFSPRRAFGLALTAGLALAGLFSWAFAAVAEDVLTRDPLVSADLTVLRFFHSHADPALTFAVGLFEAIFSPELLLSAATLGGLVLVALAYRRKDFRFGFTGSVLLATAIGTGAFAELSKAVFQRPRPPAALQVAAETGNGFPSSHAMGAVAVGAVLCYLFALRPPEARWGSWRAKTRVAVAVVVVALLVGLGRVYAGAHYPSDVLAGWALGGAWASACLTAAEVYRRLRSSGLGVRPPKRPATAPSSSARSSATTAGTRRRNETSRKVG